jgi:hypothetical protein
MAQLKSVGPVSAMKVCFVMYALIGLIIGAFVSLIAMSGAAAASNELGPFAAIMGVGAIIALPIVYGLIGALSGLIGAAVYNLCAKIIGGIELEIG